MNAIRGRRRWLVGAALLLVLVGAYVWWRSGRSAVIPIGVNEVFVVGGSPHSIAVTPDALWLTDVGRRSVLKINPAGGRVGTRTRLSFIPGEILVSGNSVWVGAIEGRLIARLDGATGKVTDTVTVGRTPQSLTAADDRIWVAAFDDGSIHAVDTTSSRLEGDPIRTKDAFPAALAWGFDSLWVADVVDDVVDRIEDEESSQEIPVGDSPTAIVVGEGSVWTANFNERSVTRIDPATDRAGDPILIGGKPGGIATGAGYVWVTRPADDGLVRIDVGSGAWTGEIIKVGAQPQGVAVNGSFVWVANQGDGTISRIQLRSEV